METKMLVDGPDGLYVTDGVPTTRREILSAVTTKSFCPPQSLLQDAVASGRISRLDVIALWRGGVISLEDLACCLEVSEIYTLLGSTERVREEDLNFVFMRLLYRAPSFPFTGELLRSWFEMHIFDGKLASLITIALWRTSPNLLSLTEVLAKAENLAGYDPQSHGLQRMLYLSLAMAAEDPEKQSQVMDVFAACLAILYSVDQITFEILLEDVKRSDAWYETVRIIGLGKLRILLEEESRRMQSDIQKYL